jgi:hypothetical protein
MTKVMVLSQQIDKSIKHSFPFRICLVSLPQCNTGFLKVLLSILAQNFTHIGESKYIKTNLNQHNRGQGSLTITVAGLLPFVVMA